MPAADVQTNPSEALAGRHHIEASMWTFVQTGAVRVGAIRSQQSPAHSWCGDDLPSPPQQPSATVAELSCSASQHESVQHELASCTERCAVAENIDAIALT
jgi:hypothetical protein